MIEDERKDFTDTKLEKKDFLHDPRIWGIVAIAAVGAGAATIKYARDHWSKRKLEQESSSFSDAILIAVDATIAQIDEVNPLDSQDQLLYSSIRSALRLKGKQKKLDNKLREAWGEIRAPMRERLRRGKKVNYNPSEKFAEQVVAELPDIRTSIDIVHQLRFLTRAVNSSNPQDLRRLLPGVNFSDQEVRHSFLQELTTLENQFEKRTRQKIRKEVYKKGIRVGRPNSDQWKKIDKIARNYWLYDQIREDRHGVRRESEIKASTVQYQSGWLIAYDNGGKVEGFTSFIPITYIDSQNTNFSITDWQELQNRQINELSGNTLLITSNLPEKPDNLAVVAALHLATLEYAQIKGAKNVIAIPFTPAAKFHQESAFKSGKEAGLYEDWAFRRNKFGTLRDRWLENTSFFADEEPGYNPKFMHYELSSDEVELLVRGSIEARGIKHDESLVWQLEKRILFL